MDPNQAFEETLRQFKTVLGMGYSLPKIDIMDQPGINLFGAQLPQESNAYMRLDQLLAGLAVDRLTPPESRWSKVARDKGVIEAWQQRPDIPEVGKLGIELAAGIVPDAVLGKGANTIKTLTKLPKAVGLANHFDDLGATLLSHQVLGPVASAVGKGVDAATKKIPGVNWLMQPSAKGLVSQSTQSAASAVAGMKAATVTPPQAKLVLEMVDAGTLSPSQASVYLGIADSQLQHIQAVRTHLGTRFDDWADKMAATPDEFYTRVLRTYADESMEAIPSHVPEFLKKPLSMYQRVNSGLKEIMLSAPTVMPNALDITVKSLLEGSNPAKIAGNLKKVAANPSGAIDDVAAFQGAAGVPAELGVEGVIQGLTGANRKDSFLQAANPALLAGAGAVAGGISGGPIGMILGAAEFVATKYGFLANTKGMSTLEDATRQVHFADGVVKYFTQQAPDFFQPVIRDTTFQQIDALAGPQSAALADALRARKFLVTPEDVGNIASSVGVPPANLTGITNLWRNLHEEARQAGIAFANRPNFNYSVDTNLVNLARDFMPFPVWPLHNVPYYAQKMIQNPHIPQIIGSAEEKSQGYEDTYGLPHRFNERLPLAELPSGSVWGDPVAGLSVAGQFSEPYARDEEDVTDIDKILDTLGSVGLGVNPLIQTGLQAAGLTNKGRDFTDFNPWTRLARPIGQALGQEWEPEGLLKGALEGVRSQTAPGAAPDSTYSTYLIRKRIAEKALEEKGVGWWQDKDYSMAMVDPNSSIRRQAIQDVGVEQGGLFVGRRALPLNISHLPWTELYSRNAKQELGDLPEGLTGTEYVNIKDNNPLAFGLSGISGSEKELELTVKQNFYYDIPTAVGKKIYLQENGDLAAYQAWYNQEKARGGKPSIKQFLETIGR